MKITTLLIIAFLAILVYAGIDRSTGITGVTQKNGDGCICHDLNPTSSVFVRIEGPSTLLRGQTAQYTIKLSGGAAVKGGFNVAAYLGDLNSISSGVQKLFGELTHTAPQNFVDTVVSWVFNFTALDSVYTDTLYSAGNSVNGDGFPSNLDKWNFGAKFPVSVVNVVPVELVSFTTTLGPKSVDLKWTTSTETNNKGFFVERTNNINLNEWNTLQFVTGAGNSTSNKYYNYKDNSPLQGLSYYRLKQVDFDGSFTYSPVVEVNNSNVIQSFELAQNFPNPFNPNTKISWQSAVNGWQTLKVYDILGNEVAVLVDEFKPAGTYEVDFDASALTSGVYLYKLESGNFSSTKKMILMR